MVLFLEVRCVASGDSGGSGPYNSGSSVKLQLVR